MTWAGAVGTWQVALTRALGGWNAGLARISTFFLESGALRRAFGLDFAWRKPGARCLGTLTTDTAGKLYVLGHDGHTLGVDGAQVGVLEEIDQVSLAGLLESHDGGGLGTQVKYSACCAHVLQPDLL